MSTLAPGLTWAYDGADGGDLLAAVATGGVPHPGGYPTYLLLTSLFAKFHPGSLAFCANLFSSLCMVTAGFFLFIVVRRLTDSTYVASLSALLFGTFPLVWSQALITEVYALLTLLSILVIFFLLPHRNSPWGGFAAGLALGLAIGNHLSAIFLLPLMFVKQVGQILSGNTRAFRADIGVHCRSLGALLSGLALGLSVFITIPIRARNQSPVNWGNPVDWDGFWWLASGAMYRGRLLHFSSEYLFTGLRLWSQFLLNQMGIIGLSIAVIYIVVSIRPSWLHLATFYLFLVYSFFAILYFSPDSYVYLILPLLSFAIWIALGCDYVIRHLPFKARILKPLLVTGSIAIIITHAILAIPEMDISSDHTAEEFAQSVLTTAPNDAIVVTSGDEALFALWYFHYAIGQRPDIAIVSNDLSAQPWYREVLKTTYPGLIVPDAYSVLNLADCNPQRTVCSLGTDLKPQLTCLP